MSVMEKLFGAFGAGAPAAQPTPPGATPPGNIPANAGATDPNNPQVPPQEVTPPSPMADFADLWKPSETTQETTQQGFLGNVDPQKVMEAAARTDFSKAIDKDTLARINAGGADAMTAMMESMNKVAQHVFAQSAMSTTKIVEAALAKAETKFQADLPGQVKRLSVTENMRNENPIFSNPAVAPIIAAVEFQLQQKNPTASASEITKMAKQYVEDFGQAVLPKPAETTTGSKSGEYDWGKFLA